MNVEDAIIVGKAVPCFISLGPFVLNDLQLPSKEILHDVPAGSGTYSALGARMVVPPNDSRSVVLVVLEGDDFPESALKSFEALGITLLSVPLPGTKSIRGLLRYKYDGFEDKTFRYTTPALQPSPKHLPGSVMLGSQCFHFAAGPVDLSQQLADLDALREEAGITEKPLLILKPAPLQCMYPNRDAHLRMCKKVDVVSVNNLELLQLFDESPRTALPFGSIMIEHYAQQVFQASCEDSWASTTVVIRASEHGCFVISGSVEGRWFPPYWSPSSSKIVETTGGGNTFLGAFGVVLQRTDDLIEAVIQGTVAASFVVEQIGLPETGISAGFDTWNDKRFKDRLEEYRSSMT